LGALVFLRQWARGAGVKLQLIPSRTVQELLDLTGLHSVFEIRSPLTVQSTSNFPVDSCDDGAIGDCA